MRKNWKYRLPVFSVLKYLYSILRNRKVHIMGRLLTISDIHGFSDALGLLLKAAKYNSKEDTLVLLGDYINKGPASDKTLKRIKKLREKGAIALLGNNELRVLRTKPKEYSDWFKMFKKLPVYYKHDQYIFSHAGFRQGVPLEDQSIDDMTGYHKEWFPQAQFEDMITIHGHTPTFRLGTKRGHIHIEDQEICIDTGAGHKRYLSLFDITNECVYRIDVMKLDKIEILNVRVKVKTH